MTCKWLFWDGSYRLDGDLNHVAAASRAPHTTRLHIPSGRRDRPLRLMVPCTVAVDILEVVEQAHCVALKLHLQNAAHIRALLVRVTLGPPPRQGKPPLVYQEVLTGGEITHLVAATASGWIPPFPGNSGVPLSNGLVKEDFHFQVWVSRERGAFSKHRAEGSGASPHPRYGHLVHDRSRPSETEVGHRLALIQGEARKLVVARNLRRQSAAKEAALIARTTRPYHLHLAPASSLARVRETLAEAARQHLPFSKALVAVARPLDDVGDE